MKRDILYTPDLDYEKKYYTEGVFDDRNRKKTAEENAASKAEIIKSIENSIDSYLIFIPDILKEAYLTPYIALKNELNNMEISEVSKPDASIPKITDPVNNKNNDGIPDIFDKGPDVYINIEDPFKHKDEIQKYIYQINFMDIYKDYVAKLNKSMQAYTYSLLGAMKLTDKNNSLDFYVTENIKNQDLYHIGDSIIRNNIVLSQRVSLHRKMFDMDETILHLRMIKVASAYIQRYYKESKQSDGSDLAKLSNAILDNSKKLADKKYNENFYALYKYLNSDVILFNESLKSLAQQARSMSIIDKYDERGND